MKFHGLYDSLKQIIESIHEPGEWRKLDNNKYQFRARNGAILNFWESSGTVTFQGQNDESQKLEKSVQNALDNLRPEDLNKDHQSPVENKQIFIVHGHDSESRDQLELVLRRLGLEPYILMNTSGGGRTIIESLEGQIGQHHSSSFGIILMTPDDMGYAQKDGAEKREPRARQNVILETGMLLSSLTRKRIALIVKGHVEIPSDLGGLIRLGFNEHIREIVPKLCSRLGESGFDLDPEKITKASM